MQLTRFALATPPPELEKLPVTVQLMSCPPSLPPLCEPAEFCVTAQFLKVQKYVPPARPLLFCVMMQLVRLQESAPPPIPRPYSPALFPLIVQLISVTWLAPPPLV